MYMLIYLYSAQLSIQKIFTTLILVILTYEFLELLKSTRIVVVWYSSPYFINIYGHLLCVYGNYTTFLFINTKLPN